MLRRYIGSVGLTNGDLLHFLAIARDREAALAMAAELEPPFRGYPLSQVHAGELVRRVEPSISFATTAADQPVTAKDTSRRR